MKQKTITYNLLSIACILVLSIASILTIVSMFSITHDSFLEKIFVADFFFKRISSLALYLQIIKTILYFISLFSVILMYFKARIGYTTLATSLILALLFNFIGMEASDFHLILFNGAIGIHFIGFVLLYYLLYFISRRKFLYDEMPENNESQKITKS